MLVPVPASQVIPRIREVGQSYLSAIPKLWESFGAAIWILLKHKPHVLLVNGPGTCIPVCLALFGFRMLWLSQARLVYVESIARVKTLSLSGKILYHSRIADVLFVQWPRMRENYPRAEYGGRLY